MEAVVDSFAAATVVPASSRFVVVVELRDGVVNMNCVVVSRTDGLVVVCARVVPAAGCVVTAIGSVSALYSSS